MLKKPIITGIICTHNRAKFLERCILSLFQQTLDPCMYEVLVVDNGSFDNTAQICEKFSNYSNFTYLFEPVLGLSNARNTGWKNAKGQYVGYIDDDAIAVNTWIEKALWSFENLNPVPEWVGGPIELEWEVSPPAWINDEYRTTLGMLNWGDDKRFLVRPEERLGGGNSFYLKSTLENMGGFDVRLGRKKNSLLSGEETQFQHRLRSRGGRMFYNPGVRIFHYVGKERARPQFFYKRYYWGGITDFIINRTLQDVSFLQIAQNHDNSSPITRLLKNCLVAIGLFVNEEKKIKSRIYMSYVFGRLFGMLKFGNRWSSN